MQNAPERSAERSGACFLSFHRLLVLFLTSYADVYYKSDNEGYHYRDAKYQRHYEQLNKYGAVPVYGLFCLVAACLYFIEAGRADVLHLHRLGDSEDLALFVTVGYLKSAVILKDWLYFTKYLFSIQLV